jgi:aromatic-amino-acid transaminase
MYSMPPDHGAAIVAAVAANPALKRDWLAELEGMRQRVVGLRQPLAAALKAATASERFDFIGAQRGMFSLLGLNAAQVGALRDRHHVYVAPDSRMNVAGLAETQIERLAQAVASVLG